MQPQVEKSVETLESPDSMTTVPIFLGLEVPVSRDFQCENQARPRQSA
jgi:hypothetical protein